MFVLLNKALISQAILIQMMAAMAFVEYKLALNSNNPNIALKYLIHVIAQAFVTFIALIAVTYITAGWGFELRSSWPWIFAVAGVAIVTMFISYKVRSVESV